MRQATTAKVRLDTGKAGRFSVSAQSTGGFNRLLPAVFRCQNGAIWPHWPHNDPEIRRMSA
jgi:hypothetical protein